MTEAPFRAEPARPVSSVDKLLLARMRIDAATQPLLHKAARTISELGKTPGWLFLILGGAGADSAFGVRLLMLLVVSEALNRAIKQLVRRRRPAGAAPDPDAETDFAFPAAHAQNAAALLGAIGWQAGSPALAVVAILVILAMAASRIGLGRHFPSDVMAGLAIGGGLAFPARPAWRIASLAALSKQRCNKIVYSASPYDMAPAGRRGAKFMLSVHADADRCGTRSHEVLAITPRLLIRTWEASDLDDYAALVGDQDVMRFIGEGRPRDWDRAVREVEGFMAHQAEHGFSRWVAQHRRTGRRPGANESSFNRHFFSAVVRAFDRGVLVIGDVCGLAAEIRSWKRPRRPASCALRLREPLATDIAFSRWRNSSSPSTCRWPRPRFAARPSPSGFIRSVVPTRCVFWMFAMPFLRVDMDIPAPTERNDGEPPAAFADSVRRVIAGHLGAAVSSFTRRDKARWKAALRASRGAQRRLAAGQDPGRS